MNPPSAAPSWLRCRGQELQRRRRDLPRRIALKIAFQVFANQCRRAQYSASYRQAAQDHDEVYAVLRRIRAADETSKQLQPLVAAVNGLYGRAWACLGDADLEEDALASAYLAKRRSRQARLQALP